MQTSGRCLIVDEMHPSIVPLLESIGYKGDYLPDINKEEVLKIIHLYTGLIVRSKLYINKDILDHAINLKFIARAGAGLDQIDIEEINKRNIQIFNAPEGNRDAVAEHAIGLILCLLNKIHSADKEVRNFLWRRNENRGTELMRKTVSILGYGFMGQAFARRLSSFGCNILAYDKYKSGFSNTFVKEASMEQIFDQTDILSLHIPLTSETRNFIDLVFLKKFRKPIYLINTARGEIVSLKSLKEGLKSGLLLGVGADVLENEKITPELANQDENIRYLFGSEKVVFTPHVAGWSQESYKKINEVLISKISSAMHM
ncbi:MAG: phosphoglycerate dehydrogenase [Bacteroidota bacterium]|nr:phosphoglycerate dehydrogenase [Bacteroidota bacterium]